MACRHGTNTDRVRIFPHYESSISHLFESFLLPPFRIGKVYGIKSSSVFGEESIGIVKHVIGQDELSRRRRRSVAAPFVV